MPAPNDIGGIAGVTTDVDGYALVSHSLGVIPGEVLITPRSPIGGGNIPGMMLTDRPTLTTFRVRALHTNGTPLANVAITFGWHAWAAPAPVAGPFKQAFQYFIGTGEGGLACTGPGVGHRRDILIQWNYFNDGPCDLSAIRAANPGARIWLYQNWSGMIAGPHPDGRPTSAVSQEDAEEQEAALAFGTPTLNYTVSGGPSISGCTNSTIVMQPDGSLHDVGGGSAGTPVGTSPAVAPQTATYWNDTPGVWDSVKWTVRVDRDPQLVSAGYYWGNQGYIESAAGGAGKVWYAGPQAQGVVPSPAFVGRTINFAIWGGVAAQAGDLPSTYAGVFDEFGTGYRVVAPFDWVAGRTYTYRCAADPALGSRWFTLYVKDELTGVETRVGSIQAAATDSSKLHGTCYQFSELFSQATPAMTCADLPRATAFIGKPLFETAGGADSWFLHRVDNGAHVVFDDYPYMKAARIDSLSWQAKAKQHLEQAKKDGFDGVVADDVNVDAPNHGIMYTFAVREYASLDEYAAATVAAFRSYAEAAHAHGLLVAANVGVNPWNAGPRAKALQIAGVLDFYMREFFTRWNGTGGNFSGPDWEANISLVKEVNQAGSAVAAVTQYGPGPQGATADARYGVASFWVARTGTRSDGWTHGTADHYTSEWGRDIGVPIDPDRVAVGVGGYQRRYTKGVAIVNSGASGNITFTFPEPYVDPSGVSVTSVTLGPTSGMVLYK